MTNDLSTQAIWSHLYLEISSFLSPTNLKPLLIQSSIEKCR